MSVFNKKKEKVKDDFTNKLLLESEFINGERNEKGKIFNGNEHLLFEREYLYGKVIGKGKGYNIHD